MRKLFWIFILALSVMTWNLGAVRAAEHGGTALNEGTKEHGGQEHGGKAMEGSHSHEAENVAVLREAAAALKATRPDLAEKLEKIAKEEEK